VRAIPRSSERPAQPQRLGQAGRGLRRQALLVGQHAGPVQGIGPIGVGGGGIGREGLLQPGAALARPAAQPPEAAEAGRDLERKRRVGAGTQQPGEGGAHLVDHRLDARHRLEVAGAFELGAVERATSATHPACARRTAASSRAPGPPRTRTRGRSTEAGSGRVMADGVAGADGDDEALVDESGDGVQLVFTPIAPAASRSNGPANTDSRASARWSAGESSS